MKKACIVFLLALMLTLGLSAAAMADIVDSGTCGAQGDNLTWTLDSDGTLTVSGTGAMEDFRQVKIDGEWVLNIPWLSHRSDITTVVIGSGVTSIGKTAFSQCSNLTSLTIPDSVTVIGKSAFTGCSSLPSLAIPDSVTGIGDFAFQSCSSLPSLTIPDSVTNVGKYAFSYCSSLTSLTIGNGVTSIADSTFYQCGSLSSLTIGNSVTSIGDQAFYGSNLPSLTIPDSVTSIGKSAFSNCKITSLTIPDSVVSIGETAFYSCAELSSLTLGSGLTYIGRSAFAFCSGITSVTIPDSVTSMGNSVFKSDSNLTEINIGRGLTSIPDETFLNCTGLTSMTIPDNITTIGDRAFALCSSLTSLTIPNSVTYIGDSVFQQCGMLDQVDFIGTQEQWDAITICSGNTALQGVNILWALQLNGSGTEDDPYRITSTADWNELSRFLNECCGVSGKYFKQTADITVTTMVGSSDDPFDGIYDGDGNTLTVNYTATEQFCAPFHYVGTAEFRNLRTAGTIHTAKDNTSGLAGSVSGNCTITNCVSDIDIAASGGNTHTGFVGCVAEGGHVDVSGSAFTGSISGPNSNYCAGFIGWDSGNTSSVTNCVYDGEIAARSNSATFVRTSNAAYNSYYTAAIGQGRDNGKQARSVTAAEGVTIDCGADTVYDVSGITAYPVGLSYNGGLCAGLGDSLELSLSCAVPAGYALDGFTANAGSLTQNGDAWTLTMPDEDVLISADLRKASPLKITTQPVDYTGPVGSTAKFTVKASGDGLTYQWWYKKADASSFVKSTLASGKKASYSMTLAERHDGWQYYCVVTDAYGHTAQSSTVTINVSTPLTITDQPVNYTGPVGSTAKFTVKASGEGLTYQWWYKKAGASSFVKSTLASGKKATYSMTLAERHDGWQYYCVVTDAYGQTAQSDTVKISIGTPLKITTQPANFTGAVGTTAKFKVVAQGDGLTYQWYCKKTGETSFAKSTLSSATKATLSLTLAERHDGYQYYCKVKDSHGNSVNSSTVKVSIGTPLKITTQPANFTGTVGTTAKFKVVAQGDGLTYQWYCKKTGETSFAKSTLTSATKATLSLTLAERHDGYQYYCKVKDSHGNTVNSNTVKVIIGTPLKITTQPASFTGAVGATAKLKVVAQGDGLTYQWYCKKTGETSFAKSTLSSATKATLSLTLKSKHDGYQYYCIVKDSHGNTVKTTTVTVHVN